MSATGYVTDDLKLNRAFVFSRAHQRARARMVRFPQDGYRKHFADALREEMSCAMQTLDNRRNWQRAKTDAAFRAALYDFADQVNGHGRYSVHA